MFHTSDTELLSPKIETFTKSPKHDHIYKLCLYMLGEHNCLKPLLHYTESLKRNDNETFCL